MTEDVKTEGVKFDGQKLPYHLIPPELGAAVAAVLGYGAEKYTARNWEKGMAWSRPKAALERHLTAWWGGEDNDPETGMPHLWHAGCCIAFLIAYEVREIGTDDRPAEFDPERMFNLGYFEAHMTAAISELKGPPEEGKG